MKFVQGPMCVVYGVVLTMDGRASPNMWPWWWVMALLFFFGMIGGLGITHLKCSILSCMHVQMTRKFAFLMFYTIRRVEMIEFGI